jgi:hypothetical protein
MTSQARACIAAPPLLRHDIYIDSARVGAAVIRWIPIDPCGTTVLKVCPDRQGVAIERDAAAKLIVGLGVGGLHVGLLAPDPSRPLEHIDRARFGTAVIRLIPVDARRTAVLTKGSDRQGVAIERDAVAKHVPGLGVGSLQVGLLAPDPSRPPEHIDRARFAALKRSSHRQRVAIERDAPTKPSENWPASITCPS